MKKIYTKFILLLAMLMVGLSSCGLFHKGCTCPHFTRTVPQQLKK